MRWFAFICLWAATACDVSEWQRVKFSSGETLCCRVYYNNSGTDLRCDDGRYIESASNVERLGLCRNTK